MVLTCRQNAKVKEMFKMIEKLQVSIRQEIYISKKSPVIIIFRSQSRALRAAPLILNMHFRCMRDP